MIAASGPGPPLATMFSAEVWLASFGPACVVVCKCVPGIRFALPPSQLSSSAQPPLPLEPKKIVLSFSSPYVCRHGEPRGECAGVWHREESAMCMPHAHTPHQPNTTLGSAWPAVLLTHLARFAVLP